MAGAHSERSFSNLHPTQRTRQDGDGDFYSVLVFTLPWETSFAAGLLELKIVNPDGQSASATFKARRMEIQAQNALAATDKDAELKLSVVNGLPDFDAAWTSPAGRSDVMIPRSKIRTDGNIVILNVKPGTKLGQGRIALIDRSGDRAVASVDVKASQ